MSAHTDTERLDWLTEYCDMGRILLDPDLEGTPRIRWNVWDEGGLTNPRDAIDAAMVEFAQRDAVMANLDTAALTSDRDPEPAARNLVVELDGEGER